jgi:hypothetical protein
MMILALASPADASPWEGSFGFGGGGETIAGDGYLGVVLHFGVAREVLPRVSAAVTFELAGQSDDEIEGAAIRALGGLDFTLLRGDSSGFEPSLVAIAGAGSETMMWDRGTLTRSMSYLGAEYRMRIPVGESEFFRNISTFGWRFGVRAHLAPGVASSTVAKLCTACEAMEPADPGLDFGLAIYMGLLFGR